MIKSRGPPRPVAVSLRDRRELGKRKPDGVKRTPQGFMRAQFNSEVNYVTKIAP